MLEEVLAIFLIAALHSCYKRKCVLLSSITPSLNGCLCENFGKGNLAVNIFWPSEPSILLS